MATPSNYYQILGVSEGAVAEAIKQAYRARVRACHPDRYPNDPTAADRFKGVTEAYEVLSDPVRRQEYDLICQHRPQTADVGDTADRSLSNEASARRPIHLRLRLSFEQALCGGKATVQLPDGRTARVTVPRGVPNGATVRLRDNTCGAHGGAQILVSFAVDPSERFRRDGLDLHVTETVSVFDALLGTERTLDDARGRAVTLVVPPGTQPGDTIRVPRRGVATAKQTGDLVVAIAVEVPRDLTDAQRETVRRAAEDAGLR